MNDRAFCMLLATRGPMTRPQLARAVGVSNPATLKVIERLQDEGLVVEVGLRNSRSPGPKAALFGLNPTIGLATSVEVQHHRLSVQHRSLSSAAETEIEHRRFDERGDIVAQVVAAIEQTAPQPAASHRWTSIGLSGPVDPNTGDVLFSTELPHWRPGIASAIVDRLAGGGAGTGAQSGVDFDNEVNYTAEVCVPSHPDGRPCRNFVLVNLSSGVGGAVVINGRVWRGARGAAGEFAYLAVPHPSWSHMQDLAGGWHLAEAFGRSHDVEFGWLTELLADSRQREAVVARIAERVVPALHAAATVLDPCCLMLTGPTARISGPELATACQRQLQAALKWTAPRVEVSAAGTAVVLQGGLVRATRELSDLIFPTGSPD